MNITKRVKDLLGQTDNPGLLPDSFDPRDIWLDEILGGEVTLPKKFKIEGLNYQKQFSYPFCASFATTTMVEYQYKKLGKDLAFSQPHLFFRGGGSPTGSSFRGNLEVARQEGKGLISENEMPLPKGERSANWFQELHDQAMRIPFKDAKRILGYARVQPDAEKLKAALTSYGPILIGVYAGGDYYHGHSLRSKPTDNHAILLAGWDERDWITFDSLAWVERYQGYGTIGLQYALNSAYAVIEMPSNAKETVEKARSEPYAEALDHYGKPRNLEAEQRFAIAMLDEFRRFNNQSVLDAAGRFWFALINAGVYGGYSLSYTKYGIWQPGDLINFVYAWRRTGEFIFDLNKVR